jgi:hypothetical protein
LNASTRAYEYGLLVVKNAFLVSGGGLFFIPAMVGLSADIEVDLAFSAGLWFALAVFLALLANYIIHINWSLNEQAWGQIYEIELIDIRQAFNRSFQGDAEDKKRAVLENKATGKWIQRTFWLPHIIAFIFLLCLGVAALNLYWAFNIFPSTTA